MQRCAALGGYEASLWQRPMIAGLASTMKGAKWGDFE